MMTKTKLPLEVTVGEFVETAGKHEINSRFVELIPCQAGQLVRGPRGGRYALTAAGAAQYAVMVFKNGKRPLVKTNTGIKILVEGEN
jgi:hypothetical protein